MVDTKNTDIVKKYFDLVQEEIKKLKSADKDLTSDQVELFNDKLFDQDEDVKTEIKYYIDNASMNNLDIKKIAKTLYDKYKLQVMNNVFYKDEVNNVPNALMGERTMNFEDFNKLNELNMNNPLKKDYPPIKIGETKYPLNIVQDAFQAGQKSILNMPSIIKILNADPKFVAHFSNDIPQFNDWWKNKK